MPFEFDFDRIIRSPFVVGGIGAVITASKKFMPGASWLERTVNAVAGALTAGFCTPALTEWLQLSSSGYKDGAAFLIGMLGMSLIAATIKAISETALGQALTSWISRRG